MKNKCICQAMDDLHGPETGIPQSAIRQIREIISMTCNDEQWLKNALVKLCLLAMGKEVDDD